MTLDERLNELAAAGNLTHLSIASRNGKWQASYSPAKTSGLGHGEGKTPSEAALDAIENYKAPRKARAAVESPAERTPEPWE